MVPDIPYIQPSVLIQHVEAEHLKPGGLTQIIEVPTWKWEAINVDFVICLSKTRRQHDSIWILGTVVKLNTAFHPQTDGQEESTIHTLKDILKACVIDFNGSCKEHMHLIDFSYNNSYHSSIGMVPFDAMYARICRSPVRWFEVRESSILGPEIIHKALGKVMVIRDRKRPLDFDVGDHVYLKISPMKRVMRFDRKKNLSPSLSCLYVEEVLGDPASILIVEGLGVYEDLSYEEVPVEIFDRQVKRLRNKEIATLKALLRNHLVEGAM
ncbi:uncharacterized protein [Solanum lycopersicum]|uniref:uncharacterized protein n=1 Tax=Solanum lycopersicum TaxID=4081 RepID=UPI003749619A